MDNITKPAWVAPVFIQTAVLAMFALNINSHVAYAAENPWYGTKIQSMYDAGLRAYEAGQAGETPDPKDLLRGNMLQVAFSLTPEMAIMALVDLKKVAAPARIATDPWSTPFYKAITEALAEKLEDCVYENICELVDRCSFGKNDATEDAIPNGGIPQVILDLRRAALDDKGVNELWFAIAHMGGSHTKLLTTNVEGREHKAVTADGTVLVKDKDGTPKVVRVAFGWRADGLRVAKTEKAAKAKAKAADVEPTPEVDAEVPGE